VPKKFLARDLGETIERMLALADAQRQQNTVLACLGESTAQFVLDNDSTLIHALIHYLRQDLQRFHQWDENELMRVGVALDEALANAVQHGNLEVDSMLRDEGVELYNALLDERRQQRPYMDRRIHVSAIITRTAAQFVVRDEGKGFDPSVLPDPTDPANLERVHGRGLLLIRTFMDEVTHNAAGNEITMTKYCGELCCD
jgi:anti-sigma regulatory factor (Ser/Thr protein kinase)